MLKLQMPRVLLRLQHAGTHPIAMRHEPVSERRSMSKYLLLIGLFLFTGVLHAQGCPEGYEPIVGQGFNGCAPRPDNDSYSQQQQPRQQAPQAPPEQWKSQWGAIATDSVKGTLGTAVGLESRETAMQAAMTDCQKKGGTPCKLEIAYDNECASMVVGNKGYSINTGATVDAANQLAMKTCSADGDSSCRAYYAACSLPVRIQ
jgi:hypothetical protein